MDIKELASDLRKIRLQAPLVQNVTNYVAMNYSANALLALGASPIMAHAREEADELSRACNALVLNIGTVDAAWIESMLASGVAMKKMRKPVVLDPAGVGASTYRVKVAWEIIDKVAPTVIRGNASEILALAKGVSHGKGLDSCTSPGQVLDDARELAARTEAIISISGDTDYIVSADDCCMVPYGSSLMPLVTAMGCTASAVTASFLAVNPNAFQAACHAMMAMGIAGSMAGRKSVAPGTMSINFIDALYQLNEETITDEISNALTNENGF